MNRLICRLLAVGVFVVLLNMASTTTSAGDEDAQKKIARIRKELDDLRELEKTRIKKEQELSKMLAQLESEHRQKIAQLENEKRQKAAEQKLREEIERKKNEEADKKNHYVKVELRGKLTQDRTGLTLLPPGTWLLATDETKWVLRVADKKELLAQLVKLDGKAVLVKGTIGTKKSTWPPIRPNRFPPKGPGPFDRLDDFYQDLWNPYYGPPSSELQLLVAVESIQAIEK